MTMDAMDELPGPTFDQPLSEMAFQCSAVLLAVNIAVLVLNLYALVGCLRTKGFHKVVSLRLALLIISIEIIKSLIALCFFVLIIRDRSFHGLQYWGCQANGVVLIGAFGMSGFAMQIVSYERYMFICRQKTPTHSQLSVMILLSCLITFTVGFGYITIGSGMAITTSGVLCMAKWTSRYTGDLIMNTITMMVIGGGLSVIVGFQYLVHRTHSQAKKQVNNVSTPAAVTGHVTHLGKFLNSLEAASSVVASMEVLRFYTLTVPAVLTWPPYGIQCFYEMIAGTRVSPYIDATTIALMSASSIPLAIFQIRFTPAIWEQLDEHLGWLGMFFPGKQRPLGISVTVNASQTLQRRLGIASSSISRSYSANGLQ